ncbi:hypothetical protein E4T56_gene14493 [Termitomyces sp. T112]|nr:hypothetical protein E4T56_gene14493 [Termitomyces sp. T112]
MVGLVVGVPRGLGLAAMRVSSSSSRVARRKAHGYNEPVRWLFFTLPYWTRCSCGELGPAPNLGIGDYAEVPDIVCSWP